MIFPIFGNEENQVIMGFVWLGVRARSSQEKAGLQGPTAVATIAPPTLCIKGSHLLILGPKAIVMSSPKTPV